MAFLKNILFCLLDISLQRYDTSKFEKNTFFTKSAAVHNFNIANLPWNLDLNSKSHKIWKNEKGLAFLRNILSVGRFVAKIWLSNQAADFGKNTFSHSWQLYTVTQAAHVFGWWWGVEGGPAYVGWPRIKRSLFFWIFFYNHKIIEKSLIYEAEIGFIDKITS